MADGTVDSSIILGGQAPQIQNPLDAMGKMMAYKSLANKSQLEGLQTQQAQQAWNDEQTLRSAKNNNMTINPDGTASVNTANMVKDLGNSDNPSLAIKAQQDANANQLALTNNKIEQQQKIAAAAGQIAGGMTNQTSYDLGKQQAEALKPGTTASWPTEFDKGFVKTLQYKAMDAHNQLTTQIAQQEAGIKENAQKLEMMKYGDTKQTDAFKDLMSHAESSRQLPDVKQAYLDKYNTQKIKDLIGTGDPDKLNPGMVGLLVSEVGKVAQGQAPTEETLKNLSPNDAKLLLSRTQQYLTSHPEASQQGAFVNVFKDYANTLQGGAQKVIDSNLGKLGNMYKDHIKPTDYKNYQDTLVNGNPYSAQQTQAATATKSNGKQAAQPDYSVSGIKSQPIGTVMNGKTKTKNGWVDLDASK